MELYHLRTFAAVARAGHLTRAAERLFISQPAVSGHIKALEEELDLRLFDRAGRNVTPTRAGELLHGYARRILALREEAQQAISEHRGGLKGHLAIGGSSIPGAYILPPLLAMFKRDHPEVTIGLHISGSRDIVRSVIEGAAELGMVGARFEEGRVQYEPFAQDELILAVAASHPWARRSTVRPTELMGQPFVMRERGSGTRKVMEEALARRDLDAGGLRVVLEVTGNEAVRQAVKAGAGVAVISRRAIEDDIRCKLVAALRVQGMKLVREFFLVTHRSRSRSPLGKTFLAFLQQAAPSSR